jgi:hypothetical protein
MVGFAQTRGDSLGQLIRPGVRANIEKRGATETARGFLKGETDTGETASREFIVPGRKNRILPGLEFIQIKRARSLSRKYHFGSKPVIGRALAEPLLPLGKFHSIIITADLPDVPAPDDFGDFPAAGNGVAHNFML